MIIFTINLESFQFFLTNSKNYYLPNFFHRRVIIVAWAEIMISRAVIFKDGNNFIIKKEVTVELQ